MSTTSPANSTPAAHSTKRSLAPRRSRALIALVLLLGAVAFFFGAGATSQRPNGANTGSGAGAVSNALFGGCVVCVLALLALAAVTVIQSRRGRRKVA
jgi:hypothetical protein